MIEVTVTRTLRMVVDATTDEQALELLSEAFVEDVIDADYFGERIDYRTIPETPDTDCILREDTEGRPFLEWTP